MLAHDQQDYVEAELRYLDPTVTEPVFYYLNDPPPHPRAAVHSMRIHNMRPHADQITLDRAGFALLKHRSEVGDLWDEDAVRRDYYPEAARVVVEATGALRAYPFDHVLRDADPGIEEAGYLSEPARRVHVDRSSGSIGSGFLWRSMYRTREQRLRNMLGDDAVELLRGRMQVITLWRPVIGPVRDHHLALCDYRTVAEDDVVPTEMEYKDRLSYGCAITHNPGHNWYYAPQMTPDEVLLIKCSDTRPDCAQYAPHAAFSDPTAPPDAPYRRSIEVRMLVFHRPEQR